MGNYRFWFKISCGIFLVCMLSLVMLFSGNLLRAQNQFKSKKNVVHPIAIITWRGITDAERGFMKSIQKSRLLTRMDVYYASQDRYKLAEIISLIQLQSYHLIYVFGTTSTKAVLAKIKNTPVVFNIVNRPIEAGIIKSWEKSGNNATGASNQVPVENQLRTLKKVVDYARLGIIYNPKEQNSIIQRNIARKLRSVIGFEIIEFEIAKTEDLPRILLTLQGKVDALYLPADSLSSSLGKEIAKAINRSKIPSLAAVESLVIEDGILLGLVPDFYQLGELAAKKALRILNGESPGQIPSSMLEYFNISVNMVTARQIDVQIPISILVIANQIIR